MALKRYAPCSVQTFNAAGYGFKKKKKLVFRYSLSLVCNDYLSLSYALQ